MGLNAELERLLLEIASVESIWRKERVADELEKIFRGLKLPIKCRYFVAKYEKNGVKGNIYRSGLISKIKLNGKLDIEIVCNAGFPNQFLEKISAEIENVTQLELEENQKNHQ